MVAGSCTTIAVVDAAGIVLPSHQVSCQNSFSGYSDARVLLNNTCDCGFSDVSLLRGTKPTFGRSKDPGRVSRWFLQN